MGKVFPPFRVDIAGTLCLPAVLKEARQQHENGQINLAELRAKEDAEVRNLVDRMKAEGLEVVTDGGYRDISMITDWGTYRQTVIESFSFLTGVTGGDVLAKQQLPSPAELLTRLMQRFGSGWGESQEEAAERYSEDIVAQMTSLLIELHAIGCRYVQFNGITTKADPVSVNLNNRVLANRPQGMYIAFHAPTDMLVRLNGVDAYFLNYDGEACDRNRLLWLVHHQRSVFGFVLSHYPDEDEMDELLYKMVDTLNYVPRDHFTLCLPDASMFRSTLERDEHKQWRTLQLGMKMAERLFGNMAAAI